MKKTLIAGIISLSLNPVFVSAGAPMFIDVLQADGTSKFVPNPDYDASDETNYSKDDDVEVEEVQPPARETEFTIVELAQVETKSEFHWGTDKIAKIDGHYYADGLNGWRENREIAHVSYRIAGDEIVDTSTGHGTYRKVEIDKAYCKNPNHYDWKLTRPDDLFLNLDERGFEASKNEKFIKVVKFACKEAWNINIPKNAERLEARNINIPKNAERLVCDTNEVAYELMTDACQAQINADEEKAKNGPQPVSPESFTSLAIQSPNRFRETFNGKETLIAGRIDKFTDTGFNYTGLWTLPANFDEAERQSLSGYEVGNKIKLICVITRAIHFYTLEHCTVVKS